MEESQRWVSHSPEQRSSDYLSPQRQAMFCREMLLKTQQFSFCHCEMMRASAHFHSLQRHCYTEKAGSSPRRILFQAYPRVPAAVVCGRSWNKKRSFAFALRSFLSSEDAK